MLIYFTEAKTNKSIAISPKHVMCVFEVDDGGEFNGYTYIVLETGGIAVNESQLNVVSLINGAL